MTSPTIPTDTRVVLAGNGLASIYVFELLHQQLDADRLLVIAPPGGRKHEWQPSLSEVVERTDVEVITPDDVNDESVVERVRRLDPSFLWSVYYTKLFSDRFLEAVDGPKLNFHPSLLPRHRGTAPLVWTIVEGDRSTGVTAHEISSGIDTGDVVLQRSIPMHPMDTGYVLQSKVALLVRAMAAELLRAFGDHGVFPQSTPQVGIACVHRSTDPSVNHIDWTMARQQIIDVVRALAAPLPGAFTIRNRAKLLIDVVTPVNSPPSLPQKQPGMVELSMDGNLLVWAGDGLLRIDMARMDDDIVEGSALVKCIGLQEGEVFA